MDTRTCVLAALVAAAVALAAGAQPAGARRVASPLRSSSGVPAPRKVFDFVIQKAEVRELGSGHFFLPPPKPSYVPPPPPPPPPPSPIQHTTPQHFKPSERQPIQPSVSSTDSENLLKKLSPSKQKPTSREREREDENKRLLPSLSPAPTTAKLLNPTVKQKNEPQANVGRAVPVQLPPYFPINTYATYTLPTYFAQLPQRQLKMKETPHFLDSGSNSLGSVGSAEQGEVPSLLGLDISRTSNGGRRGKTMEVENSEAANPSVDTRYGSPSRQQTNEPHFEQTGTKTRDREEATGSVHTNRDYSIESPSQKIVAADSVSIETVAVRETAMDSQASSPQAIQVEATKAAIADAASRAVAGEVAGPGLALTRIAPRTRLVTALAVRRHGGVAIAGPGGTAAAGSGGVAVVGPGGVAYARPNALSVVGPGGRVVALPVGAPEPRAGEALPVGARVVAIGPTVYLHPADAQAPPLPPLTFY